MAFRTLAGAALLAAAAAQQPAQAADSMAAADARVSRMGRTVADRDGRLRFGYAGVTLGVALEGRLFSVELAGGANSLLDVVIDGGAPVTLRAGPQPRRIELLESTVSGPHHIELVHRTETSHGVVSVARFFTDGRFLPAPPLPERKLLVLGDSVTCGASMERAPGGKDDPRWWNARLSYGMLLGRQLDAQVQLVCYGGRGLVRSWNGRTDEAQLPAFYHLAIAADAGPGAQPLPWRQQDYAPDLILVAIGTNDFAPGIPPRALYVDTYEAFVRSLLRDHPQARIALTEGAILDGEKKAAMSAYIAETVARVGSERVSAIPSRHHPGDAADMHPTTAQHAEMARELAPLLARLLRPAAAPSSP